MKATLIIIGLAAVLVAGCKNPGIVQLSPNTYMLSREDHAGIFGSKSALKAGVIRDANAFAAKQGKIAVPVSTKEHPVGILGDWASFEYQFRVLDKNDPEAAQQQQTAPQSSQAFKRLSVERRVAPSGLYAGVGDRHWIKEVLSGGKLIRLEDDSL